MFVVVLNLKQRGRLRLADETLLIGWDAALVDVDVVVVVVVVVAAAVGRVKMARGQRSDKADLECW